MDTKLILKFAGVVGSIFLLAACASTNDIGIAQQDDGVYSENIGPAGAIPGSQEDLEQNAGHRVFFGLDQYTLTPQAQATLARQAAWLKQYPETRITVSGNCDERGTREYNLALGARRAEAARAYLASLGVDSARVTTVSYGKERPIDPRSTGEAWSLNRNATTSIVGLGS